MTEKRFYRLFFLSFLLLLCLFLAQSALLLSETRDAIKLVGFTILPSLFPYLVVSGLLSTYIGAVRLPFSHLFERLFGLPAVGMSAFFLGCLCGFPIGVKVSAELYRAGHLEKQDAERLAALSANTGPAFPVAVIGGGIFGDVGLGWWLYFFQIITAVLLGIRYRPRQPAATQSRPLPQNFTPPLPFATILYQASLSMLGIAGTLIFFSALSGFLCHFLPSALAALLAAFLEVGSGSARAVVLPAASGVPIASFALSFSGVSVIMQNASFLTPHSLSILPLLKRKLLQGALAALLALLLV